MPYRVIVCGGRNYWDARRVIQVLDDLLAWCAAQQLELVVLDGRCFSGADHLAATWARANGVQNERYPADWEHAGRAAGPQRNARMLATGANIVVAFPGGPGTADMSRQAGAAGLRVVNA